MTEATVTTRVNSNDPTEEVVVLTATDGNTYICKKLSTITAATACGNEDQDAHINVTFSGATATINYAGMTTKKVTLELHGRK